MKRRLFLKGLIALPFGLAAIKQVKAEPIKQKVKKPYKDIDIKNTIGGDGGYLVSYETNQAILKIICKNSRQIKRMLR